jgi:hypothetical protein
MLFGYRYSGALDLVSQAEAAFESWALSQVVHPNRKVNRCFPDGQVLEALVLHSTLANVRFSYLAQFACSLLIGLLLGQSEFQISPTNV